jgi:hypothetical protein
MRKIVQAVALYAMTLAALFVAFVFWLQKQQARDDFKMRESILQARVAEAETERRTDSVQVVKWATKTVTSRDTLLLHLTDTQKVKEFVYQTDTLRINCLACVVSAAKLSAANDSLVRLYRSVRPTWKDRFGLSVCYAPGQQGPIVGAACAKVWP